jgi:hypothetical protein
MELAIFSRSSYETTPARLRGPRSLRWLPTLQGKAVNPGVQSSEARSLGETRVPTIKSARLESAALRATSLAAQRPPGGGVATTPLGRAPVAPPAKRQSTLDAKRPLAAVRITGGAASLPRERCISTEPLTHTPRHA